MLIDAFIAAKKLPKSEGGANQGAAGGRRLENNEQNKPSSNCCK